MNTEPEDVIIEQDIFTNRRYQIALTAAILLIFVMLTLTTLVLILASGREDDRQAEFDSTLTAIFAQLPQQNGPPGIIGYPAILAPDSPTYSAAAACQQTALSGAILDRDGAPTDAFAVAIWGDQVPYHVLQTGSTTGQAPGEWALTLDDLTDRHIYVQLTTDDRYHSTPVTLTLSAGDCERNAVTVEFIQVAPLD